MTDLDLTEAMESAYLAAGRVMVRVDDDGHGDEFYEWHHCVDMPACNAVQYPPLPCSCSGVPWPSAVVRAGIEAAVRAAAPVIERAVREEGPTEEAERLIRHRVVHEVAREIESLAGAVGSDGEQPVFSESGKHAVTVIASYVRRMTGDPDA